MRENTCVFGRAFACGIVGIFGVLSMLSMTDSLYGTLHFTSYDSSIALKHANSKLDLENVDKVIGWGELSINKKNGPDHASQWAENYAHGVVISQEGSQEPNTNLIISNSNAINYGLKNNSNATFVYTNTSSPFTMLERQELLEDVRTDSHAFVDCCKNTSNALVYGIKNNSTIIASFRAGVFPESERQEFFQTIRTTSNGFLYCCKNTSHALAYGIRNNSNALETFWLNAFTQVEKQEFVQTVRTTSNAFLYCCKNTSNALVFGIRNNSNALVNWPGGALWSIQERKDLYETIRVNSNAFLYCCKNTSNVIVMLEPEVTVYDTHQVYTDDAAEESFVLFKDGFAVPAGKTLMLDISAPVNGQINLNDTGVLQLLSDVYLNSDVYFTNGGVIKGGGKALGLFCNMTIPENQVLRIAQDTIINGYGKTITLEPHARITIDNNVTLTIKNARIKNTRNSSVDPMVSMSGSAGRLALQNCELALACDYYVDNGHLFIHDDVIISGTSSLVYTCSHASYIADAATWGFDKRTRFFYDPSVNDNTLIRMQDTTSCMYFDGSMLQAGDMGLRLSKGALYFDNHVTLSCPMSTMIIFGDLSQADGDLDVCVFGAGHVEIVGVVYDDSV